MTKTPIEDGLRNSARQGKGRGGWPMDLNHRKEYYSCAFIEAVAATAGFVAQAPGRDLLRTDWEIWSQDRGGVVHCPVLAVQLKCTAQDVLKDGHVAYQMDVATYDALSDDQRAVPVILVVVVVPDDPDDWLDHTEDRLQLSHCAYWRSLAGEPPTTNTSDITVHIPRDQQLTVGALRGLMERVGNGGKP